MDTRNTVEITLGGRRFKLTGNESAAYMQKVAEYVNGKYDELKEIPGFTGRSQDYQMLMMYLNLADDYLKQSGWTEEKQAVANNRAEEEIYRLKMELVEARKQMEAAEAVRGEEIASLKKQLEVTMTERQRLAERDREYSSRISGMEKELNTYKTEKSILNRKVSDHAKNSEQVERQLKETAAREREEKLLRNNYEKQIAAFQSQLAEAANIQNEAQNVQYEAQLAEQA